MNDARDRWQRLVRKLEAQGAEGGEGAQGAQGRDQREKRKSMFLRRLATSARDKPDHVSDEDVPKPPASVDYTLTYADISTPSFTAPCAAGKAKFTVGPHVLYVCALAPACIVRAQTQHWANARRSMDSMHNSMTFGVRVQYDDGSMCARGVHGNAVYVRVCLHA